MNQTGVHDVAKKHGCFSFVIILQDEAHGITHNLDLLLL